MNKQKTVFITGANKGLGLEFTQQYSKNNYQVFGCCRNLKNATELLQLTKRFPYIKLFQADITNKLELEAIAEEIGNQHIDIIINNAGFFGTNDDIINDLSEEVMLESFKTNTIAPLTVIQVFYDKILAGEEKKIINISSNMASISNNTTGGSYSYRASKAALNVIMKNAALELQTSGIKILLLHPGWIKANIDSENADLTVEQSVESMIEIIDNFTGNELAPFLNYNGTTIPW